MFAATHDPARSIAPPVVRPHAIDVTLYVIWGLFWLLMILVAIQDTLSDPDIRWWEPIVWEGSSCIVATLWFAAQRWTNERYAAYLDRPAVWVVHHLKWLPFIAASFLFVAYALRHAVYGALDLEYRHEGWAFLVIYETAKVVLFAGLWLGIIFGFNSYRRWQEERGRLLAAQKALADTQLQQLRSQLRPHLFFNVLNTISALMHTDVDRADRLLARLGDLLRSSLHSNDRDQTTLQEELRLLRLYADVMHERFADRVTIEWHVEQGIEEAAVPSLILQPLLENAFKHAVEVSRTPVRIDIAAHRQGDRLLLCVRNSGSRLEPNASVGIGIGNCRQRLNVLYGAAADLNLVQKGDCVEAQIELPWRRQVA